MCPLFALFRTWRIAITFLFRGLMSLLIWTNCCRATKGKLTCYTRSKCSCGISLMPPSGLVAVCRGRRYFVRSTCVNGINGRGMYVFGKISLSMSTWPMGGFSVVFFFTRLLSISHSWVLCLPIKYLKETVFIAMCFGRGTESICFKLLRFCFNPAGEHVALPGSYFRVCVCVYVGTHQIVTWCSASWNCQCRGSLQ